MALKLASNSVCGSVQARPRRIVSVAAHAAGPRSAPGTAQPLDSGSEACALTRRQAMLSAASAAFTAAGVAVAPQALAAQAAAVGSYLPASGVEDFVLFVPDKNKTPVRHLPAMECGAAFGIVRPRILLKAPQASLGPPTA